LALQSYFLSLVLSTSLFICAIYTTTTALYHAQVLCLAFYIAIWLWVAI